MDKMDNRRKMLRATSAHGVAVRTDSNGSGPLVLAGAVDSSGVDDAETCGVWMRACLRVVVCGLDTAAWVGLRLTRMDASSSGGCFAIGGPTDTCPCAGVVGM